jgi:integrase
LRLYDGKGRRKKPRVHELPLTGEAIAILRPMVQRAEVLGCDWVFTSNGKVPIVPDTLTGTVSKIAEEMVKDHESRFSFIPSDIRRTVETLFASKGISRDIRAQIQSHGLSGVQVRHYDKHDYRDEKRRGLEFLAALLHGMHDTKLVPLHSLVA